MIEPKTFYDEWNDKLKIRATGKRNEFVVLESTDSIETVFLAFSIEVAREVASYILRGTDDSD